MRRFRTLVSVGITTVALAACSSTGIPADTSASASASVTQPAPSVWSAPDSASDSVLGAGGSTTGTARTATTGPLPGLSRSCSAAVRAQLAVNELFSQALKGDGAPAESSTAATTSADATVTDSRPANITTTRVDAVFGGLSPAMPRALDKPIATLRTAADDMVGKTITEIPAILNGAQVTAAMSTLGDYVTDCRPTTSE